MKIAIIDLLGLTYDGSTLTKRGLGGSESAVILISKELSKIGFNVTVYNNCIDSQAKPGMHDRVNYVDHTQSNPDDIHDLVISSRSVYPFFANNKYAKMCASAKHKVLWMHDTFCQGDEHLEAMLVQGFIDEVFTLSDFHSTYITNCDHGGKRNFEMLKHKFFQTRNGAVKHIDEVDLSAKDPNYFVYNASVTKGLIPLIETVWPSIKRALPDAHLTVIGGYYRFREGAEPDEQEKILRKISQSDLPDVTFTGVIPQFEIAKILANATFMLYPTAFPETFGISSLESLLYKTPIITCRFGALEETAIDLACYKLDYSATPNSLFPNIDATDQSAKFSQLAINAANNPYLLQQKQNYCDVVSDIYSWETVALQWKQHFYTKLGLFLDVESYRTVSRINDKVARVFGRRFNNTEDRRRYMSSGVQQQIIVVSPFWNAEKYIANHILSVAQQDYNNYYHVLIDDASTDNSYEVARDAYDSLSYFAQSRCKLISNNENVGAICNQIENIRQWNDDAIIMLLDGDDWLVNNDTIFHLYNDLYHQGADFTYGSMWSVADNIPLIAQTYPKQVIKDKSYRQHKFNWGIPYTHLRTFRKKLINFVDDDVFWNHTTDDWMRAGADNPLFYELIERAENPVAVKEIVCNYNDINPLNDYKVRTKEQTFNAQRSYEKDFNRYTN